ncbi:hypothetical protein ACFWP5_09775 [Streptomyces sp. NPDC058469]|uniref:hypothetical protein n=1 Tax=Streptomyces sp. NPDC058469 TaxID=3346514 RepID=UPI00366432AB
MNVVLEPFSPLLSGEEAAGLLVHRSISDGTTIYLDGERMMPVEPLCSWGRNMSYADLARSTLKDYGRITARFAGHQEGRGRDVLSATESDLVAFKKVRTQLQERPIGTSTWGKESGLMDQFFGFAVDEGYLSRRPVRVAAEAAIRSPRVRRGMDVPYLTLDQYRCFRDVGLGGQRPNSRVAPTFRGWAPHRNHAGSDLALGSGARWHEWATVQLPEVGIGVNPLGQAAEFTVQACATYGKTRTVCVPEDAVGSGDTEAANC